MRTRREVGGSPGESNASTVQWSDPASEAIHAWLNDFVRAAKSFRLYADNNEMLNRLVDRAWRGLEVVLQQTPELNLSIRADRLLVGKDAVHINPDREDGIPFTLYRNAFRRITFLQGFERAELVELMRAISADYTGGTEQLGEDLVAALWRLALPHLRYVTIDAFAAVATSAGQAPQEERMEIERIQESVEDIVAAIYQTNAPDEDIVAGVSITKEDLEALRRIREESGEDLETTDQATARIIAQVAPEELEPIAAALEQDSREGLVQRIVDILIHILFQETSRQESAHTVGLIQQLFDSMVLAQRFSDAAELVERLRARAVQSENPQEVHIARRLIRVFASEQRIVTAVEALEERSASVQDKVRFLRSLGPDSRPVLLDSLDNLSQPGHRRLLIELIREFGAPPVPELQRRINQAKWFVVRDLLSLSQAYPLEQIGQLIVAGLGHEHPKVRQHAVGLLRGYGPGLADKLLAERLTDADSEVRLAAMRTAAARKSLLAKKALEEIIETHELHDRSPRELRTMMAAYAAIAGVSAVPILDRVLNAGFFARLKGTEPQVAAAMALGSIGGAAHDALHRGTRTLNNRVRDACRRALSKRESDDLPAVLLGTPESPPRGSGSNDVQPLPGSGSSDDLDTFVGSKIVTGRPVSGPDLSPQKTAPVPDLTEPLPDRRAPRPAERPPENPPPPPSPARGAGPSSDDVQVGLRSRVATPDSLPPVERSQTPAVDDELRAYLDSMDIPAAKRKASRRTKEPKVDDLLLDPSKSKGSGAP